MSIPPSDGEREAALRADRAVVRRVRIALERLATPYQTALRLRYASGLTLRAVASRMGRSEESVGQLCHRGLARLGESLESSSRRSDGAG